MPLLEKLFGFDARTMIVRTELVAGLTTFMTMCYILAVNPAILSATGMDRGALFTATALASAIATILLAVMAKLPFAQAPSMGLNAFFAFTLCQAMGYSWRQALAIMLIEGLVFILITFLNVRERILDAIPTNLRYAVSAGIGMFIAFIGLKNAGIIVSNEATFVGLGDFTPTAILGWIAIVLSAVLMTRRVKGSLFYGIIAATLIGIPLGVTQVESGWIPISLPKSVTPTFLQFDFTSLLNIKTVLVVISLLLVNIFDTVGTLVGLCYKTGNVRPDGSDSSCQRGDDERRHRYDLWRHARLQHYHDLCRERKRHCRRRTIRTHFLCHGTAFPPGPLPGSALPAHSQRGDEWCAGHRRRTDARRHQAHRDDGYVRGLPEFRHGHHDGALL